MRRVGPHSLTEIYFAGCNLDVDVIVPGHGDPCSKAYLERKQARAS